MADTWDELQLVLAGLRDRQPGALLQYPTPGPGHDRQPPFDIHLAPWAAAAAADLHRQFGTDVDLTVGALPYPPGRPQEGPHIAGPSPDLLDPSEITAALDGPATVGSGHTLRHGLLLHNLTSRDVSIATNGHLTTVVVDPATGETVGGFAGAQHQPLIIFRIPAGRTQRVPLLTGTASFTPRLGYAVPPGSWGIEATLTFGPHSRRRTPVLPLTITA